MNVFEDLIVELKQENLLESSVLDDVILAGRSAEVGSEDEVHEVSSVRYAGSTIETADDGEFLHHEHLGEAQEAGPSADDRDSPIPAKPARVKPGKEFFKKRAVSEVSSLQMVEHIITSIEREYLKVVPAIFDDLEVKKALHNFVQSLESDDASEHASAEFALMQETEEWCSALGKRDKNIPVGNLRLYCETARPPLSSQAVLAVAKFYRNLPYSELVRAKFDFVMTRLFTRNRADGCRACLFDRAQTIEHVNSLYSDWSSVPLYAAEDDESRIMLAALSLDELAAECEAVGSFDQLAASDFFGRLRIFKESITELFLAPEVITASIEANVRIGNAYIKLLAREREKLDAKSIASKYADLDHDAISEATGQSLGLAELLTRPSGELPKLPKGAAPSSEPTWSINFGPTEPATKKREARTGIVGQFLGMNRWVMVFSLVMVLLSVGIWLWSDYADEKIPTTGVSVVDFGGSPMAEYIKTAKVSSGTLYAQMLPAWDALPAEKRREVLQRILQEGPGKGYRQVNLLGKDGRSTAFASSNRLDVNMP